MTLLRRTHIKYYPEHLKSTSRGQYEDNTSGRCVICRYRLESAWISTLPEEIGNGLDDSRSSDSIGPRLLFKIVLILNLLFMTYSNRLSLARGLTMPTSDMERYLQNNVPGLVHLPTTNLP